MRIYTRTGDDGTTGLFGGSRIGKDELRIEAYGTLDELNAWIGKVRSHDIATPHRDALLDIQGELFTLGSHLATTDDKFRDQLPPLNPQGVASLEAWMDGMDEELPPLKTFILPGGTGADSDAHLARVVCRRAERRCVALHKVEAMDAKGLAYLNRLSDALFLLGRWIAAKAGHGDTPWTPRQA